MSNKLKFGLIAAVSLTIGADAYTLSEAYMLALKNDPKLKSMQYRSEATQEQIVQNRARLLPQVQGSVSWGYYGYEAEYLTAPVKETYSSYSLSASQAIFHPEYWRSVDESKARAKSSEYEFQAQSQQLGLDVAKSYFEVIKSQKNVDLSRSQKEFYESKFNQLQEMLKLGLSNRIDLLEAKVHRDRARSEWLTEEKRLNVAKLKLEHYTGEKADQLSTLDFDTVKADLFDMERQKWEAKLPESPIVKSALFAGEMARHQVAIREYAHYPKVDLNLARKETYTEDRVAHQYDNQAIIQMSIPIYEGGNSQSRVREGLKLLDSATQEIEYRRKENLLRFEAFWSERTYSIEKIEVLRESQKSAELYLTSVEQGHAAGLKSVIDLLEARAKLYEVKRDLVDAGYELINNQLSLLDVCGELNGANIEAFESRLIKKS